MDGITGHERNQRVVTFLNRDEVDFLDKMGKDAFFSSGSKVSRAKLISWLVDMLKGLNINGENIKTEADLERRIVEALQHIEGQKTE
ncbi:MAG: hypothetical protein WCY10_00985 [Candidatus Omnitrophota bacterium]